MRPNVKWNRTHLRIALKSVQRWSLHWHHWTGKPCLCLKSLLGNGQCRAGPACEVNTICRTTRTTSTGDLSERLKLVCLFGTADHLEEEATSMFQPASNKNSNVLPVMLESWAELFVAEFGETLEESVASALNHVFQQSQVINFASEMSEAAFWASCYVYQLSLVVQLANCLCCGIWSDLILNHGLSLPVESAVSSSVSPHSWHQRCPSQTLVNAKAVST